MAQTAGGMGQAGLAVGGWEVGKEVGIGDPLTKDSLSALGPLVPHTPTHVFS